METNDIKKFCKIEEACGNRYLAINMLSKNTRELGKRVDIYHLLDSKLLEWVITGDTPYSTEILELRKARYETIDDLEELLLEVSDKEVVEAVKSSYHNSIKNKRLTLCTDSSLSKAKQSRANILLRMIWYNFNN